jgi:WD40 repeat protein
MDIIQKIVSLLLCLMLFAGCTAPTTVLPAATTAEPGEPFPTANLPPTITASPVASATATPIPTETPTALLPTSTLAPLETEAASADIPTPSASSQTALLAMPEKGVLRLGKGYPASLAVAPESKLVAIGSPAGIFVYHLSETGQALQLDPLWAEWIAHGVSQVAFSTSGAVLAGVTGDAIRLWDGRDGKPLRSIPIGLPPEGTPLTRIALSPDGKTLAAIMWNQDVSLWETVSGNPISGIQAGQVATMRWNLAFGPENSPSAGYLAVCIDDNNYVFALQHSRLVTTFADNCSDGYETRYTFTPDGKQVLAGGSAWDMTDPPSTADDFVNFRPLGNGLFSPDMQWYVHTNSLPLTEFGYQIVQAVRLDQQDQIKPVHLLASASLQDFAFLDAQTIIVTSNTHGVQAIRLGDEKQRAWVQDFTPFSPRFSPDGNFIVGDTGNNTYFFWDARTGEIARQIDQPGVPSPDFNYFITSSGYDQNTYMYQLHLTDAHGNKLLNWEDRGPDAMNPDSSIKVAYTPDSRQAIVISSAIYQIDLQAAKIVQTVTFKEMFASAIRDTYIFRVSGAALLADRKSIAAVWQLGDASAYIVYDPRQKVRTVDKDIPFWIDRTTFSTAPSASLAALSTWDGKIILTDASTGQTMVELDFPATANQEGAPSTAISPDGKTIAASMDGGPLCLWDADGANERCYDVDVWGEPVFSPDGQRLAFNSNGQMVVWNWME